MILNSIEPEIFAETFSPKFRNNNRFKKLKGDDLIKEVLFSWYEKSVRKRKKGGQEPRRALAKKLSELKEKVISRNNSQDTQVMFERLAKVHHKLLYCDYNVCIEN